MKKLLLFFVLIISLSLSKAQTITTVAGASQGTGANQLNGPNGVFLDHAGNIYVSDFYNNRIQKFPAGSTSSTSAVTVAGGNGSGSGLNQLSGPFGIYVNSAGDVYVADAGNFRIIRFDAGSTSATNGVVVAGGNGTGTGANQLGYPEGVYVDAGGAIYAADASGNRIQKFPAGSTSATNGITIAGGNGSGHAPNQLSSPESVFVDGSGNVYVVDAYNYRVQKFPSGSSSSTNGTTVAGGNGQGSGANQLSETLGIYVDANGNIFVADQFNNRVQKFPAGSDSTTNGVTVAGGNGVGSAANQLDDPDGVYVATNGDLYISDQNNNRIQKYSGTNGIASIPTAETGISLYPNPNNGSFTLESTGSIGREFFIYDLTGRVAAQGAIYADKQQIQPKGLSVGTYTLEIEASSSKAIRFTVEQ